MHASKIVGATNRQVTWHPAFVRPSNNIYVPVFIKSHHLCKEHDSDKIHKSNHNTHNTVENYTIYSHYQTMKKYSWFQAFAVFRMLFVFFWVIPRRLIYIYFTPAFEDGTDSVFRNVRIYKSDAGESPKRKQTTMKK